MDKNGQLKDNSTVKYIIFLYLNMTEIVSSKN